MEVPRRKQCAKCPWKKGVDPRDIPGGYSPRKHARIARTIAEPGALWFGGRLRIMACHETDVSAATPCVGWLVQQLGPGNNIGLRMLVARGQIDARVTTVGPQRERFEDTLPGPRKRR
jgi:hypothetical protein